MNFIKSKCACPCCGNKTITEPGAYEICRICKWEDDPVQSGDIDYMGGANKLSLREARLQWSSMRSDKR